MNNAGEVAEPFPSGSSGFPGLSGLSGSSSLSGVLVERN